MVYRTVLALALLQTLAGGAALAKSRGTLIERVRARSEFAAMRTENPAVRLRYRQEKQRLEVGYHQLIAAGLLPFAAVMATGTVLVAPHPVATPMLASMGGASGAQGIKSQLKANALRQEAREDTVRAFHDQLTSSQRWIFQTAGWLDPR